MASLARLSADAAGPRVSGGHADAPSIAESGLLAFAILLASAYGVAIVSRVWQVGPDGLSRAAGTVPYWDFSNLWAGARLAMHGELASLFDPGAYRHGLARLLHAPVAVGEWSYPPIMLLVGVPLAMMPIGLAYTLWTSATIALHALSVRGLRLPRSYALFAILSPALVWNVALGQNGALTGALLLAGLIQAERRPVWGGMLLGCLVIKPHLAILVPFALLARGNMRAIGAAAVTAFALVLLSATVWGWAAWHDFFTHTGPMMRRVMEAPFPQGYHARSVTVFILARALGFGVSASYLVQAASACLAIGATCWSARWRLAPPMRAAIVITLTFLATPYSYTYDMVALAGPLALLLRHRAVVAGRIDLLALALWFVPCMPLLERPSIVLPLAPILLAAFAVRTMTTARTASRSDRGVT